jgi:hypothetical protein
MRAIVQRPSTASGIPKASASRPPRMKGIGKIVAHPGRAER